MLSNPKLIKASFLLGLGVFILTIFIAFRQLLKGDTQGYYNLWSIVAVGYFIASYPHINRYLKGEQITPKKNQLLVVAKYFAFFGSILLTIMGWVLLFNNPPLTLKAISMQLLILIGGPSALLYTYVSHRILTGKSV